jgi:hypothetical protein
MFAFLRKGIELQEKINFLADGCVERIFIPENRHVIPGSSPQLVGMLWVEDLFKKMPTIEESFRSTQHFDFCLEECFAVEGDYFERFFFEAGKEWWRFTLRNITNRKRNRGDIIQLTGDEKSYEISKGSIKSLDSYLEKMWTLLMWESRRSQKPEDLDELDWDFYLHILFLLIQMFPKTNVGIQDVFKKFNDKEEKYCGGTDYKFPWDEVKHHD